MGPLQADSDQVAWIPVAYAMPYVGMNLLLVRLRQQFGLRPYAMVALIAFCMVAGLHIFVHGLPGAILIHAAAGVAGAPLGALAAYYVIAAFPAAKATNALILTLGLMQIATPLAGTFSDSSIAIDDLRTLYMLETGLALVCLGSVALLRLPPSRKVNVLEPLDFVTFLLFSAGAACVCAVLGLGPALWWSDAAWLGWASAAAVCLLGSAMFVEVRRARPVIDLQWLSTPTLLRFALIALATRLLLSEQSSVIAFLGLVDINNEELHLFSAAMCIAGALGAVVSSLVFKAERIPLLVGLSLALIAIAAFSDAHATSLSRADQFLVSQMMISFSLSMFFGPALLFGIGQVLKEGGGALPSLLVVFISTQVVGSLAGGAVLKTFQFVYEKSASAQLVQRVDGFDPSVAHRISQYAEGLTGASISSGERTAAAVDSLQQAQTLQANILGYDNTFMLVAVSAGVAAGALLIMSVWQRRRASAPARSSAVTAGAAG